MKADDLENYFRLTDPNNTFLKQVAYGDAKDLK
jgi:hypothetical protein